MTETTADHGADHGQNYGEVIDAEVNAGADLPAELARKVAMYWDQLVEAVVQVRRDGKFKLLARRLNFQTPPDKSVDEICVKLCEIALGDCEKNGDPDRYRARLKIQIGGSTKPVYRYAEMTTATDSATGAMTLVDYTERGEDGRSELTDLMETMTEQGIRCLTAVADAAEGYGRVSGSIERVVNAHASMVSKLNEESARDVERDIALAEQQMRNDALVFTHEERMDRNERLGDFMMEISGPFSDMLEDVRDTYFGSGVGAGPSKGSDKKRSRIYRLARDLDNFFRGLSEQERAGFGELFGPDERKLLESARVVQSEEEFLALFAKLEHLLAARFDDGGKLKDAIVDAVGLRNAAKLRSIMLTVARKAKG